MKRETRLSLKLWMLLQTGKRFKKSGLHSAVSQKSTEEGYVTLKCYVVLPGTTFLCAVLFVESYIVEETSAG